MSTSSDIYRRHAIPGHPVQYLTTALLVGYLKGRYPSAWARNGMHHLLHHIRNLDARP